ncbi:NAD(+) synthase [Halanaerocella petrolearia]
MLTKDYQVITDKLIEWIKGKITNASCKGVVVGLSGGIDSSVTAVLSKRAFPDNTLGLIMPCDSNPQDAKDARLVAEKFDIDYKELDLTPTFNTLLETIQGTEDRLAISNIKPRLRMTTLYYYAKLRNSLVVGTDNRSELRLGYFTKYGDGGIDLAPLGNLVKTEVREISKVLEIPDKIITKAPSAGLWKDQTDEEELGVSYQKIDKYILTGEASKEVKDLVDRLEEENQHKLQLPPIPEI